MTHVDAPVPDDPHSSGGGVPNRVWRFAGILAIFVSMLMVLFALFAAVAALFAWPTPKYSESVGGVVVAVREGDPIPCPAKDGASCAGEGALTGTCYPTIEYRVGGVTYFYTPDEPQSLCDVSYRVGDHVSLFLPDGGDPASAALDAASATNPRTYLYGVSAVVLFVVACGSLTLGVVLLSRRRRG